MTNNPEIAIFWFRRDLRYFDNNAFFQALNGNLPVLPLFIFDENILEKIENKKDPRLTFIYRQLENLQKKFQQYHSSLLVKKGKPLAVWEQIVEQFSVKAVYSNHDYEPYARKRDQEIANFLQSRGIDFYTFKDQVIFEKAEVLNNQGNPYTVFTPYKKKWLETLSQRNPYSYPCENLLDKLVKNLNLEFPLPETLGFSLVDFKFPLPETPAEIISEYEKRRDYPFIEGTTRLGIHLRFGTISIRELLLQAQKLNSVFLSELIWREFFMMILWHFPRVVNHSFRENYDKIEWENNPELFEKWKKGETGYPLVDAGMRELNETGFMHNRVRMSVASFLCKHLLIDWRKGERYFAEKLLDYELSANNGNWQWAAGSGCDAAPYFRIFNPLSQQEKFDPDFRYIKRWVPEFGTSKYPKPIIDHKFARERALEVYKKALKD